MLKDIRGISVVVGIVLLVVMTVVWGVIGWNYISGMVSNPGKLYLVGVKVQKLANSSHSDIVVTYIGGPDHDKVAQLCINFIGVDKSHVSGGKTPTAYPIPRSVKRLSAG